MNLEIDQEVANKVAAIQVLPDEEIERLRRASQADRVKKLRREAGCPVRAMRWCALQEQLHGKFFSGHPQWNQKRQVLSSRLTREGGSLVVLAGKQGRGKTTMATSAVREWTESERTARWGDLIEFVLSMQDAKQHGRQMAELREWERPALLVIDQADKVPDAEWENRLILKLIDSRYNLGVATLLLSNVVGDGLGDLAARLGASIMSRIKETGSIVQCDWEELR